MFWVYMLKKKEGLIRGGDWQGLSIYAKGERNLIKNALRDGRFAASGSR
ncbi:hypothetical protein AQULUS_13850 [Aquicella lusitana]|uniref:Uncharacterized protein n=1 Tax=Aquicella lusitana TaxID=254246 RepID=A0A370GB76_9COXI|nr:hypothetical protein C8D86_1221 [Aquicella lusitana]VVC73638.1 hypothetical protein AQULUS_13850 [Aquicella lusitana]